MSRVGGRGGVKSERAGVGAMVVQGSWCRLVCVLYILACVEPCRDEGFAVFPGLLSPPALLWFFYWRLVLLEK